MNMWCQHLMHFTMPNYFKMDLAHFSPSDILAWDHPKVDLPPFLEKPSPAEALDASESVDFVAAEDKGQGA